MLFPCNFFFVIVIVVDGIPIDVKLIMLHLVSLLPVLNSLFNPLIYAVRIRNFRVAFIQLLLRKTIVQAEQLEKSMSGAKQSGVVATVKRENRVTRKVKC